MQETTITSIDRPYRSPGEHVNFNASPGSRTRARAYPIPSACARIWQNRNGSVSTTIFDKWYLPVTCADGQVRGLDLKELARGKRLTLRVRTQVVSSVEAILPGAPLTYDAKGAIDYPSLLRYLDERRAASTTE